VEARGSASYTKCERQPRTSVRGLRCGLQPIICGSCRGCSEGPHSLVCTGYHAGVLSVRQRQNERPQLPGLQLILTIQLGLQCK
jgi:hypothetical protein